MIIMTLLVWIVFGVRDWLDFVDEFETVKFFYDLCGLNFRREKFSKRQNDKQRHRLDNKNESYEKDYCIGYGSRIGNWSGICTE